MIGFSTFLRFSVQLANLIFAHSLGVMYRETSFKTPALRQVTKRWRVRHLRKEHGFVGIVQFEDGTYYSIAGKKRKPYKTLNGAIQFFNGTKYEGKIPVEPTEVSL